ncbi:hypothetical protein PV327_007723 [Microctonus hyperodae]|uniref:Uncharacterized protein n=1 Tax=Microctonus hyperodae TaxID=165561 RepID=A0AA39G0J3_MICHY|nr:hypothetical protein PV327_007723 [Microctonus hyperodae]
MVVAAINDSVIIPSNPSMALTGVVVTSTFNPDQHIYNSTGYGVEQEELDYVRTDSSDLRVVILIFYSTAMPIFLIWIISWAIRFFWLKYTRRRNQTINLVLYDGAGPRDDTAGSLHHQSGSASVSNQQELQILSAQDNFPKIPEYITNFKRLPAVFLCLPDILEIAVMCQVSHQNP